VIDAPRFAWRGVLLDVGRHFFPLPFILKLLDVCAFYKISRFHWHLTEDQARRARAAGSARGSAHSLALRMHSSSKHCPAFALAS
jgi:hypothetical protein